MSFVLCSFARHVTKTVTTKRVVLLCVSRDWYSNHKLLPTEYVIWFFFYIAWRHVCMIGRSMQSIYLI